MSAAARLTRVVVVRGCRIPEALVIGEDPKLDVRRFEGSDGGVTPVTAEMLAALG
jgi:glucose-1-phosphate adenylyltransferase